MGSRMVTCLASLLLAACASTTPVPDAAVGASATAQTCEGMQGVYVNRDDLVSKLLRESLAEAVWIREDAAISAAKVRLTIAKDGSARFTPLADLEGDLVEIPSSSRLVLTCTNGILSWSGSIRDLRDNNRDDVLMGSDNISFEVQRGPDRALYFKSHEGMAGLIFGFLPFGGTQNRKYRFQAAD